MKKSAIVLVAAMAAAWLLATDGFARGGGGRGGGGGARMGGGGPARPAARPAVNRSPSMSRAAPARPAPRPAATGGGKSLAASRPAPGPGARPSVGAGQGIAANRPAQGMAARPGTGGSDAAGRAALPSSQRLDRPSPSQLSGLLNMPAQPGRSGVASSTSPRPSQLPAGGGTFGKTVTGLGGGQTAVGGAGSSRSGPRGATMGAGRVGTKVTGLAGNTYTRVAGGAAVRGPGGNVVAAGRGASFVNGQFVGGKAWTAVNRSFTGWNYFTPGWYGRYATAWWPGTWALAATAWSTATWASCGSYCGCTGEGVYYDYGQNVVYEDGNVYYGEQPVASSEQYYEQAGQIAASGETPQNEKWLPLGVFAVMAAPSQTKTDKVLQLAVNKDGVIRGNLHDSVAGYVKTVIGAVDKEKQRVAMKFEGNDSVVVETGLYNLTNDEVPVLVHSGADQQEIRTLIRLKQPQEEQQQP